MKKYQQLILVILSVLSFVSLLIYRHEYNKLRYVLEVFNFFGTPGVSPHQTAAQNVDKYFMSEPLPAWQRVSDTLYLYSAYWEEVGMKGRVKAPAIGILNENLNYGCYLWYEMFTDPVKGQFSFSELPRKKVETAAKLKVGLRFPSKKSVKTKGFMFYCEAIKEESIPIGVTFYKMSKDETSQALLPVYRIKTDTAIPNSTAICVLPNEYTYLKKQDYLNFLSFHRSIGVKDFIIYGANFQYEIISIIMKDSSFDTNLMVLHWNYPFSGDYDLMMDIAENDCILRANGLFENVLILKWNQFFVPKTHATAQTVISNLDPNKKISTFHLYASVFCLEDNDDPTVDPSVPGIFKKTKFGYLMDDDPATLHNTVIKNGSTRKVYTEIVKIHWYKKCNKLDLKTGREYDRSIQVFQSEVLQSKIMRI